MIGATLFSGIGAPEAAMPHWRWAWHAEIEKFPNAVMAARHPNSINLGDVSADDFTQRAAQIARPNVLIFGSPCQSYSIAGKRLGMDDPRGNLALTALGIVDRLKPDWFVFENVPGLFSSFSGSEHAESEIRDRIERGVGQVGETVDAQEDRDLATFLTRVQDIGYSGAWTVLDAQYRGVAQRRDRVFFVGHIGDWRAPTAVLLEPESLRGHSPPSREAGQDITGTLSARTEGGGGLGTDFDLGGGIVEVAMALNAGAQGRQDAETETMIPIRHGGSFDLAHPLLAKENSSHDDSKETYVVHALTGEGFDASEDGTGRGTPLVAYQCQGTNVGEFGTLRKGNGNESGGVPFIAYAIQERAISENPNAGPDGVGIRSDGAAFTLEARTTPQAVAFNTTQITSKANRSQPKPGDPCHPLAAGAHAPAIAFDCKASGQNGFGVGDIASTLRAMGHANTHQNGGGHLAVAFDMRGREGGAQFEGPHDTANIRAGSGGSSRSYVASTAVRRLTPRECERLQGFPDDFTLIEYRGKPAADGPRYKALGNSMAVPVIRLILERIEFYETIVRPQIERAA